MSGYDENTDFGGYGDDEYMAEAEIHENAPPVITVPAAVLSVPIPPMHNYTLDLRTLTPSEEQFLRNVLARDAHEMEILDNRISTIRKEINEIRKKGALSQEDNQNTMCARCKHRFWILPIPFVDNGVRCIRCKFRICAKCRQKQINNTWLCILCFRYRQEKILSGEWMLKGNCLGLYGSDLMRCSLRDKDKLSFKRRKSKLLNLNTVASAAMRIKLQRQRGKSLIIPGPQKSSTIAEGEQYPEDEAELFWNEPGTEANEVVTPVASDAVLPEESLDTTSKNDIMKLDKKDKKKDTVEKKDKKDKKDKSGKGKSDKKKGDKKKGDKSKKDKKGKDKMKGNKKDKKNGKKDKKDKKDKKEKKDKEGKDKTGKKDKSKSDNDKKDKAKKSKDRKDKTEKVEGKLDQNESGNKNILDYAKSNEFRRERPLPIHHQAVSQSSGVTLSLFRRSRRRNVFGHTSGHRLLLDDQPNITNTNDRNDIIDNLPADTHEDNKNEPETIQTSSIVECTKYTICQTKATSSDDGQIEHDFKKKKKKRKSRSRLRKHKCERDQAAQVPILNQEHEISEENKRNNELTRKMLSFSRKIYHLPESSMAPEQESKISDENRFLTNFLEGTNKGAVRDIAGGFKHKKKVDRKSKRLNTSIISTNPNTNEIISCKPKIDQKSRDDRFSVHKSVSYTDLLKSDIYKKFKLTTKLKKRRGSRVLQLTASTTFKKENLVGQQNSPSIHDQKTDSCQRSPKLRFEDSKASLDKFKVDDRDASGDGSVYMSCMLNPTDFNANFQHQRSMGSVKKTTPGRGATAPGGNAGALPRGRSTLQRTTSLGNPVASKSSVSTLNVPSIHNHSLKTDTNLRISKFASRIGESNTNTQLNGSLQDVSSATDHGRPGSFKGPRKSWLNRISSPETPNRNMLEEEQKEKERKEKEKEEEKEKDIEKEKESERDKEKEREKEKEKEKEEKEKNKEGEKELETLKEMEIEKEKPDERLTAKLREVEEKKKLREELAKVNKVEAVAPGKYPASAVPQIVQDQNIDNSKKMKAAKPMNKSAKPGVSVSSQTLVRKRSKFMKFLCPFCKLSLEYGAEF